MSGKDRYQRGGYMKAGKSFEIFVKKILMNVGFLEVQSDDLFVFDGNAGQMVQGLGEAHNADVLLEPPVQTPFIYKTRLLIECKDYNKKVGLNTVRSALGLREDVNSFEIVDRHDLEARRSQRRNGIFKMYDRCIYQVAVASMSGFTTQAQKFAATHHITLIEFDKMDFWVGFKEVLHSISQNESWNEAEKQDKIIRYADHISEKIAVAITNSGQILFLYREVGIENVFSGEYRLVWVSPQLSWKMSVGGCQYGFQLPDVILKQWINNMSTDLERRREAISLKEKYMSNMIVYYWQNGNPAIGMISIDESHLGEAKERLGMDCRKIENT